MDEVKLWNEQYLPEAFLTSNRDWKILGALNYLHHYQDEKLKARGPYLTQTREPGSFYIEKVRLENPPTPRNGSPDRGR